jgi:phosphatidylglycerol:prolipoprotein diacylglycerol transferase
MWPVLVSLGPLNVRTYGFLLALAFVAGLLLARHRARVRGGVDPDLVTDMGFYLLLAGILGARIFFVAQNLKYYLVHPLDVFKIWEGGLAFYGSFIGALLVAVLYLRRHRIPFFPAADIFAPPVALGQAIGRLGCLAAGCCHGLPSDLPWAVTFPRDPFCLAPQGIPLHPTQLYNSLAHLLILGILLLSERKPGFPGRTLLLYVILTAAARFGLDFLRGDDRGRFLTTPLTAAQGIGLVLILVAAGVWIHLRRNREGGAEGA